MRRGFVSLSTDGFLSAFDAFDSAAHFADFVNGGDCGCQCYCLESEVDKKMFAVTFVVVTVVFHNLECLNLRQYF